MHVIALINLKSKKARLASKFKPWQPALYFTILVTVLIAIKFIFPTPSLAYTIPIQCSEGTCHSGSSMGLPYGRRFDELNSIEGDMDTFFVWQSSNPDYANRWPNLSPDCDQGGCHEIVSSVSGKPNLLVQHIGRSTTTFPNGMGCSSCHHGYNGSKLRAADIAYAIYWWDSDCYACHRSNADHEPRHDTTYVNSRPVACEDCHSMVSVNTGSPNLWTWHLNRVTTSYPAGMDCQSCHNYSGSKLVKTNIDNAISSNSPKCDGCHSNTMHGVDPNTDHRTSYLGDTSCNLCHVSRSPVKDTQPNLQDIHMGKKTTSYPGGMDCNSCHSYSGTKLLTVSIDNAISSGVNGNTRCDACHTVTSGIHEEPHNTNYLEGELPLECQNCHLMKSSTTTPSNTANLRKWHIGRSTTSYPAGMNCGSCHNYGGSKLDKNKIARAIANDNTKCDACHSVHDSREAAHDTVYLSKRIVDCSTCHSMVSKNTKEANLRTWHLSRKTTSYPSGMNCSSCHNYSGSKLIKSAIDSAISAGNTNCSACHSSTIHALDDSPDHRSYFMGTPGDCLSCHKPSRPKKDSVRNLQDLHMKKQTTSYPKGMNCNSCHRYKGSKLNKKKIKKAIAKGGFSGTTSTKCAACHSVVSIGSHELLHNTKYDSSFWPNLAPDCRSCHEMKSDTLGNEGKSNLWVWHLKRKTPTYPKGMNCQSCHSYKGTKLSKIDINKAISSKNTDCSACHELANKSHALNHDTQYIDNPLVACQTCHPMESAMTGKPNLWIWHLKRKTTSFPRGMNCQSCHDYKGTKLSLSNINQAIYEENTRCDTCHKLTIHLFDPNTDHRTNFTGKPKQCSYCHAIARHPRKDSTYNLQDYHVGKKTTSYPSGMTCNSCHNYKGIKLSKKKINDAIALGGYAGLPKTGCAACHKEVGPHRRYQIIGSGKRAVKPGGDKAVKATKKAVSSPIDLFVYISAGLLSLIGVMAIALKKLIPFLAKVIAHIHFNKS